MKTAGCVKKHRKNTRKHKGAPLEYAYICSDININLAGMAAGELINEKTILSMKLNRSLLWAFCIMLGGGVGKVCAQRSMDKLGRGLIATVSQSGNGNFVGWRVLGEEYYDVTYNLYADGVLVARELGKSNYVHEAGTSSTQYTVAPVVRGKEGEKCGSVTRWETYTNNLLPDGTRPRTGFLKVPGAVMTGRDGADLTMNYEFNDAVLADVDGDGMPEIIAKRLYSGTPGVNDVSNTTAYNRIEVYTIGGDRLWSIDIGPNMQSGPDGQFDAVAFDSDGDGKAEVLMRGADNMMIHHPDGTVTEVGDMKHDIRKTYNSEYSMPAHEYLLYMDGATGKPYTIGENGEKWMDYPCKRLESGETDWVAGWGDGTGHRATKHYFGAPYLDGRHPSVFIGRGCYTRHKFYAFDVDPATHRLTERWHWMCNTGGPWFGQGYHNFAVADVDMDGRDEIMFGSMTIDDNGYGLSTTGLGHGDAQHCGDLDPYRFGQEQFTCNETSPAMNYRNATTSQFYYRVKSTSDDGRALAANFYNTYPGSQGQTSQTGVVSLTADKELPGVAGWPLNFRIYWDGDLCSEVLDSPGTARQPKIDKPGVGRIFLGNGAMNNSSKNNACATGDLFGDWREELLVRDGKDLLIYTSNIPTEYRIPTLWHDHQYRQGMVWETIGYNQPPHPSYFLGELEGITIAPPPLTVEERTLIGNGGSITSAHNGSQMLVFDNADTEVTVEAGAEPWVAVFNTPSWVQGTARSECTTMETPINYTYYTCTVKGGGFGGATRLVKQGEGTLVLPDVEMKHSGHTDVWNGTLVFNGTMKNSPLWLNRHTKLVSAGTFRSIRADYNATVWPAGDGTVGVLTTDTLRLGFGSRVVFDLAEGGVSDRIDTKSVSIETKSWTYGPQYLAPVFEFKVKDIQAGRYLLCKAEEIKGSLSSIIIEGIGSEKSAVLVREGDAVYLTVDDVRGAAGIVWTGAENATWDFAKSENFMLENGGKPAFFVTGDKVTFNDEAVRKVVSLAGNIEADSVIVDNTAAYTFNGSGALTGTAVLVKRGNGTLTVETENTYTGGTRISGGKLVVNSLSNDTRTYGGTGGVVTSADKFVVENGATLKTTENVTQGSPMKMESEEGGCIENDKDYFVNAPVSGTCLTKKGGGWLKLNTQNPSLARMVINGGTVQCLTGNTPARTVEYVSGTFTEITGSAYAVKVQDGGKGTWNLANNSTYTNSITGSGMLTVYCPVVRGNGWFATRTRIAVNMSRFTGTLKAEADMADTDPRFTFDTSNGMPEATLNITAGVTVQNSGKTFRIGKLAGSGALGGFASFANNGATGINTWQVGCDEDFTWGGKVTAADTKFEKVGSGQMTASGAWDNTGEVTVQEGTLCIRRGSVLGTGALTIQSNGVLAGVTGAVGNLANASVSVRGTVRVGATETATSGVMGFGDKNVTVYKTGIIVLGIASAADESTTGGTSLQNIRRLNMNGLVRLNLKEGIDWHEGDSIVLWKAAACTGTPVLENYVVDASKGLYWDDTDLLRGVLRVTARNPDAVRGINADGKEHDGAVYDLSGRKVSDTVEGLRPGVYVRHGQKITVW